MRPFAEAITAYAVRSAAEPERHGWLPAADSKAIAELAGEQQWATDGWLQPVQNAHSFGAMLTYFLAEQLDAIAAIIRTAEVGPRYSYLANARAIIDTAPVAFWLLDPDVGIETRVKRGIAYRMDSANQQGRLKDIPGAAERKDEIRAECETVAAALGWEIAKNQIGSPIVGGETIPHADTFATLAFEVEDPQSGPTMWAYLSAVAHGTWYALTEGMAGNMVHDPLDPHSGKAPIVVEAKSLYLYGLTCYHGTDRAIAAHHALMGWDPSAELATAREQMNHFNATLARWATDNDHVDGTHPAM